MNEPQTITGLTAFLWAIFGGFGAELAVFFSIRHSGPNDFPFWVKSPFYYVISLIMIFFGGGFAVAYLASGFSLNPIMAIHVGASTPLILRKIREAAFPLPQEPSDISQID